MFGNAVCSKQDAEYMASLGSQTKEKDETTHMFLQPCSLHTSSGCSIYDDPNKPKVCSSYKCALLKRVLKNEITPEQAIAKVERIKKAKKNLNVSSVREARKLNTDESNRFVQDMQNGFYGNK